MRLVGWGCNDTAQLGSGASEIVTRPHAIQGAPRSVLHASAGASSSVLVAERSSSPAVNSTNADDSKHAESSTAVAPDAVEVVTISNPDNEDTTNPHQHAVLSFPSQHSSVASTHTGDDYTLFLTTGGTLLVTGSGPFGQLGHGKSTHILPEPSVVPRLKNVNVVDVAAGSRHWLALDSAARVYACGHNAYGQCGSGDTENLYEPKCITSLWAIPVTHIAAGDKHSAILAANGDIFCIGSNQVGQLGQPAFHIRLNALYPARVAIIPHEQSSNAAAPTGASTSDVVQMDMDAGGEPAEKSNEASGSDSSASSRYIDVACGSEHTVALRSDGGLVCWGKGENGQVGTRGTANAYGPVLAKLPVEKGATEPVRFVSVAAGARHSAAISSKGDAYLWGDGSQGQIGDGDLVDKLLPVKIKPPTSQTAALTADETGQDAMDVEYSAGASNDSPVESGPLSFVQIMCGAYHNLAFVSASERPVHAAEVYNRHVHNVVVDEMMHARSGLNRFGSAAVLYHTFVEDDGAPNRIRVRAEEAVREYSRFVDVFQGEGETMLARAATKLRHEAQGAFGMLRSTEQEVFSPGFFENEDVPEITKASHRADSDAFRCEVADNRECGALLFQCFFNPTYWKTTSLRELAELASLVVRIRRDALEAFVCCAENCIPELLLKCLIRPLHALISDELRGKRKVTKRTLNAVRVLALCHRANEQRMERMRKNRATDLDDPLDDIVPPEAFYNDAVSDMVDLQQDWLRWTKAHEDDDDTGAMTDDGGRSGLDDMGREKEPMFSFCQYPFVLNKVAKHKILAIETGSMANSEAFRSIMNMGSLAWPISIPRHYASLPFLVLRIQRSNIVSDTFSQLSAIQQQSPNDLHKTLKVEFEGEDGLDEGGVRKEFFQVLTEHLFSPDYGMFEYHEATRHHWFRRNYIEDEDSDEPHPFFLVGIALGVALFNSILLDIQFPSVVYRKLHGAVQYVHQNRESKTIDVGTSLYKATMRDVAEVFPEIANSLQKLLQYEGDDVEDVFCLTYEAPYESLFGESDTVELIPNGANQPVTKDNREDFVRRYVSYLIDDSIDHIFKEFAKGMLFMLNGPFVGSFSPDELETLVVGEKELDFEALRATCKYEGYTVDSPAIQNLWTVLFELDTPMRQKFLSFVTGSDRAPVGGLGNLGLVIQNAGRDSDRLPTSHTCFNVLLLPDYATRAKLRELLLVAIQNSEGFGLR